MRVVFLDTVGLLATWDVRDQWHALAAKVFEKLIQERATLVTTEFVLAECGNAASRKPYRNRVPVIRNSLTQQGRVAIVNELDLQGAWESYRKNKPGTAGIVDELSFVIMRKLDITEAFTNDQHFRTAGFTTLF
jgi:predicted nucleic acid-binding protein